MDQFGKLQTGSRGFAASRARESDSYRDPYVRSIIAIAPAPTVRAFAVSSLQEITLPVTLITGGADDEAPAAHGAEWLHTTNENFDFFNVGADVGHFTFLGLPEGEVRLGAEVLFRDLPGVSRAQVHADTAELVFAALGLDPLCLNAE